MAFLVRWLHVSSVAFLFGGALLIFILLHFTSNGRDASSRGVLLDLMRAFEWGSWLSLGLVVATGVGNLAHFGEGLPDPGSEYGRELAFKLGLVMVFLVFSAVRTLAVMTEANRHEDTISRSTRSSLRMLYGGTAASTAAIVAVAVSLAHF